MEKKFIATGKDFDSAVQAALKELGLELEDVSVQLLERAKNGVFGFGARPCKVEITYETPDPAPTPALSAASRSKPKKRLLRLPGSRRSETGCPQSSRSHAHCAKTC
ncbi:MAG: Jag N-terminal domain-containing protein [Oscillospiraceae bacterium]